MEDYIIGLAGIVLILAVTIYGFNRILRRISFRFNNNMKVQAKILRTVEKLREDIAKGDKVTIWPTDFEVVYIDGEAMGVRGTVEGKRFCCSLQPETINYATGEKVDD